MLKKKLHADVLNRLKITNQTCINVVSYNQRLSSKSSVLMFCNVFVDFGNNYSHKRFLANVEKLFFLIKGTLGSRFIGFLYFSFEIRDSISSFKDFIRLGCYINAAFTVVDLQKRYFKALVFLS